MAEFKCKICGGNVRQEEGSAFGTCSSCGITSTLSKAEDEKLVNLFNRGNHFRRLNEFDKALNAYRNILKDNNSNAEAHWCAVLCRYGIEYVKEPNSGAYIPIFHRVQYVPILTDADYLLALSNTQDSTVRDLYAAEANKLNEIQKDILAISYREEPYDAFICYNEAADPSTEDDLQLSQELYDKLVKERYRVFFSHASLKGVPMQMHEAYIFSAINSAKLMLILGTSKDSFYAVSSRNSWVRFHALTKGDRSRAIIPCYRDMDLFDMPDDLSDMPAIDIGDSNFADAVLTEAKGVLGTSKAAIADLNDAKTSANLNASDYTAESWALRTAALALAENSTSEIVDKTAAVKASVLSLVFAAKEELENTKAAATELAAEDFTPESWKHIHASLQMPEDTNSKMTAKLKAITNAAEALVFAGKGTLDTVLVTARGINTQEYTAASRAALNDAISMPETTNAEIIKKTKLIKKAIASLELGKIVVIIGRPNVGKSSLLNAISETDVAIVTDIAGTTRDIVRETIEIDGIPVRLLDTAGIRETYNAIERIGVERAFNAAHTADLVLLVVDGSNDLTKLDTQLLEGLQSNALILLNKSDLGLAIPKESFEQYAPAARIIEVSAVSGDGLVELYAMMSKMFKEAKPEAGGIIVKNSFIKQDRPKVLDDNRAAEAKAEEARRAAEANAAEEARRVAEAKAAEEARRAAEAKAAEEARKATEANAAEEARRAAEARAAEEARKATEANAAEEARKAAEAKAAEEARRAAEAKAAEEARRAAEAKAAEEARRAAEAKAAEEARKAAEAKAAEEARKAAEAKAAEEARRAEEAKAAEEARKAAEAKAAEEARKAAEAKAAEEARKVAEAKAVEEARKVAEAKAAEEARKASEAKAAEEARKVAEAKAAEETRRVAEEARRAAEAKAALEARRAAEAKAAEDARRAAPPPSHAPAPAPSPSPSAKQGRRTLEEIEEEKKRKNEEYSAALTILKEKQSAVEAKMKGARYIMNKSRIDKELEDIYEEMRLLRVQYDKA
ncbi:MAG: 50S ribosome-binding GTPase [Clostridiales bacterium]|jgi:small GTP-binding protein|nr:50S ribosome-binding GTPase [Clostridiales bacterium]